MYCQRVHFQDLNSGLFLQENGQVLKLASLKSAIHKMFQAADIPKSFAPHSIRGASLSQVAFNGMDLLLAEEHVHISHETASKHYRRRLQASEDVLREVPTPALYSDYIRRRFWPELAYSDLGAVLDDNLESDLSPSSESETHG